MGGVPGGTCSVSAGVGKCPSMAEQGLGGDEVIFANDRLLVSSRALSLERAG